MTIYYDELQDYKDLKEPCDSCGEDTPVTDLSVSPHADEDAAHPPYWCDSCHDEHKEENRVILENMKQMIQGLRDEEDRAEWMERYNKLRKEHL